MIKSLQEVLKVSKKSVNKFIFMIISKEFNKGVEVDMAKGMQIAKFVDEKTLSTQEAADVLTAQGIKEGKKIKKQWGNTEIDFSANFPLKKV